MKSIQEQGVAHPRCVIVIEAREESGSGDLPAYMDHLKERIGVPSLIVCLDSGSGNYDQVPKEAKIYFLSDKNRERSENSLLSRFLSERK